MLKSSVPSTSLRTALRCWQRLPAVAGVPDRSGLDPTEIIEILPDVFLLDVLEGGERFRFRLAGTRIVDRLGLEPTDRFTDEVTWGDHLERISALFRRATRRRVPIFAASRYEFPPMDHRFVERLIMPMTHGGSDVAILFVVQKFGSATRASDRAIFAEVRIDDDGTDHLEPFDPSEDLERGRAAG